MHSVKLVILVPREDGREHFSLDPNIEEQQKSDPNFRGRVAPAIVEVRETLSKEHKSPEKGPGSHRGCSPSRPGDPRSCFRRLRRYPTSARTRTSILGVQTISARVCKRRLTQRSDGSTLCPSSATRPKARVFEPSFRTGQTPLANRSPPMKRLMFACLAFTLLTALTAAAAHRQDTGTKPNAQADQAKKSAQPTKTVVGCLQKGDEPGEFAIRGEDGMVWELKSTTVKLEEHIGHKVSVTGPAKEEAKEEAKDKQREKREGDVEPASKHEEYGDIRVTSLKMISDT